MVSCVFINPSILISLDSCFRYSSGPKLVVSSIFARLLAAKNCGAQCLVFARYRSLWPIVLKMAVMMTTGPTRTDGCCSPLICYSVCGQIISACVSVSVAVGCRCACEIFEFWRFQRGLMAVLLAILAGFSSSCSLSLVCVIFSTLVLSVWSTGGLYSTF